MIHLRQRNKEFLVMIDEEYIRIYPIENLSYTVSCNAPLEFRGEASKTGYKSFRKDKYIPITETDVAKLFAEDEEIIEEKEQQNEQNYYTT